MTKQHRPPAFPRALLSFINLPGPYGTLDIAATGAHTVEFTFSDGDFVTLNRDQWSALRAVVDPLFGFAVETVVVATDPAGEPLVVEEQEEVVTRRRRTRPRKRRAGA